MPCQSRLREKWYYFVSREASCRKAGMDAAADAYKTARERLGVNIAVASRF